MSEFLNVEDVLFVLVAEEEEFLFVFVIDTFTLFSLYHGAADGDGDSDGLELGEELGDLLGDVLGLKEGEELGEEEGDVEGEEDVDGL